MMPEFRWLWRARPVRVVDGDTVDVLIDRGFRATQVERVRLLGVDTPEVVGVTKVAGLAARDYVRVWIFGEPLADWPLLLETFKPDGRDAFGRWLCAVWRVSDRRNLNEDLIAAGHAVPWSVSAGETEVPV